MLIFILITIFFLKLVSIESKQRLITPTLETISSTKNSDFDPSNRHLGLYGSRQAYLASNFAENMSRGTTVRIYGDTDFGYILSIYFFGSNFQKASLIIDTGSSITAIPCYCKT